MSKQQERKNAAPNEAKAHSEKLKYIMNEIGNENKCESVRTSNSFFSASMLRVHSILALYRCNKICDYAVHVIFVC